MKQLWKVANKWPLPPELIVIPSAPKGWEVPQKNCQRRIGIFGAGLYMYPGYAILNGFLGYPYLYTLLETLNLESTSVFFLGTAGALDVDSPPKGIIAVDRVFAAPPLDCLADTDSFALSVIAGCPFPAVSIVSVDIIQRETPAWLEIQKQKNIFAVEMELFPLAAYLNRPVAALLVLTDRVTTEGIYPFTDKKRISGNFSGAFQWLKENMG